MQIRYIQRHGWEIHSNFDVKLNSIEEIINNTLYINSRSDAVDFVVQFVHSMHRKCATKSLRITKSYFFTLKKKRRRNPASHQAFIVSSIESTIAKIIIIKKEEEEEKTAYGIAKTTQTLYLVYYSNFAIIIIRTTRHDQSERKIQCSTSIFEFNIL